MNSKQKTPEADFARLFLTDLSADATGEMLREFTFPGEGYGCYDTFDVREGAERWTPEARLKFWEDMDLGDPGHAEDAANMGEGYTLRLVPGVLVNCCWYWDGDGTLAFQVVGPGWSRLIVNNDCKKSYRWEEW